MNKILNESEITVIQKNNQTIMNMNETIKNLSKKISDFETSEREKKEKGIVIDPGLIVKRNNLKELVNNSENKEKYLLDEINKNKDSFNQAKEMLKDKIAYYDEIIERELKYARLQKYEEDVYNNNQRYYYENFDY
jgi:2-succinyl-5-enolpyruvyl-6-hydroxy-3-cyclohexene-1-carboxylate synthase